ncbi:MAG: hypothetical protein ABFS09_04610 [Thermodesulfobacteriota bacterium]
MKNHHGLSLFAAFLMLGCTAAITPQMLPLAESLHPQSEAELAQFSQGRQSLINQCSGCHYHMWPSEYTPRQWKQTMKEHIGRTHLNKADFKILIKYIIRASELSHQE